MFRAGLSACSVRSVTIERRRSFRFRSNALPTHVERFMSFEIEWFFVFALVRGSFKYLTFERVRWKMNREQKSFEMV
jgi:hypothetical protein